MPAKLLEVRAGSQKVLVCLERISGDTGLGASMHAASPSLSVGKLGRGRGGGTEKRTGGTLSMEDAVAPACPCLG